MKKLVDYLLDNGEFTNNESALALKIHLTSVSYYEQKAQANKVVKHMIGLKRLLEHQQAEKVISDEAYKIQKTEADYLQKKWQKNVTKKKWMIADSYHPLVANKN